MITHSEFKYYLVNTAFAVQVFSPCLHNMFLWRQAIHIELYLLVK